MTRKPTRSQIAALAELLARPGHASKPGDWTRGRGNYISLRGIPPFCTRVSRWEAARYPRRIRRYFDTSPRLESVVAVVDVRAAKRAIAKARKEESA